MLVLVIACELKKPSELGIAAGRAVPRLGLQYGWCYCPGIGPFLLMLALLGLADFGLAFGLRQVSKKWRYFPDSTPCTYTTVALPLFIDIRQISKKKMDVTPRHTSAIQMPYSHVNPTTSSIVTITAPSPSHHHR